MNKKLLRVAPSPHVYSSDSVSKIMYGVVIALMPALLVSLFYFGLGALIVTTVSVVSCILFEYLISKYIIKSKPEIWDGSAIVTGLLLAFNVPSNLPIWIIIIGALVAIGIGKMSFGGLGNNPFNPALVGRVFLLISFPVQMTSWPKPIDWAGASENALKYLDASTGATPLDMLKQGMLEIPGKLDMFIGEIGGSLGEVSAVALIIGGLYMLYKKIISWHIPVSIILSVAVFTGIFYLVDPTKYADPLFHLLGGGLMLGAIFMATDMVTSPMSIKAMIIFGVGIGLITSVIRLFGSYPEGVSFAILVMNAFVPLMNKYMKPKRFGEVKNNG